MAWIGPRTGDRTVNSHRYPTIAHRPTDAARRPSAHELSRRGTREAASTTRGSRFPRCVASRHRQPHGVELADLHRRFVGTERFLRRRSLRATVAVPEGTAARPRKAVWCRPASPAADTARTNHPEVAEIGPGSG